MNEFTAINDEIHEIENMNHMAQKHGYAKMRRRREKAIKAFLKDALCWGLGCAVLVLLACHGILAWRLPAVGITAWTGWLGYRLGKGVRV